MPKIFLSYRREDTAGYAGRIAERLTQIFGHNQIFQDLEDIQPGVNFAEEIQNNIVRCDILLALIGPRWLTVTNAVNRPRLDDPHDFVRLEIAAALERGIRVIPVLVQKAAMPAADVLPQPLKLLAMHQAIELSDARWEYDIAQLVTALGGKRPGRSFLAKFSSVTALLVAGVAAGWFYFQPNAPKTSDAGDVGRGTQPGRLRVAGIGNPDVRNAVDITGQWIGRWTGPQGKEIRIRFNFEAQGQVLMGSVRYPTGEGGIHEGRIDGDRLLFVTRHTPQFEEREVTISFTGRVKGDQIEFIMQRPNGAQRFVATRVTNVGEKP